MSEAKLIAAMQRQTAEAEVERLRLVGELEEMRLRAAAAESMLASVSGVTRLELVAAERARCAGLLAACKALVESVQWLDIEFNDSDEEKEAEAVLKAAVDAIAAAEVAP